MKAFDKDYIQARTDALKIMQSSLQQLMTLSAAGLALFFSFIGKAQFVTSITMVGIIVVWCWITSLCMAAVGHKIIGSMVTSINNFSSGISEMESLSGRTKEFIDEINKSINPHAASDRIIKRRNTIKNDFDLTTEAFIHVFFPMQRNVIFLVKWSLVAMVAGFIAIGTGYSIWVLNSPLAVN